MKYYGVKGGSHISASVAINMKACQFIRGRVGIHYHQISIKMTTNHSQYNLLALLITRTVKISSLAKLLYELFIKDGLQYNESGTTNLILVFLYWNESRPFWKLYAPQMIMYHTTALCLSMSLQTQYTSIWVNQSDCNLQAMLIN